MIAECTAYDFKVMLEEKKTNSWLKSSVLTRICYETKALDGYKEELKPVFKSTPTLFQAIIYATTDTQNVGDFVGEPTFNRTCSLCFTIIWCFKTRR